MKRVVCILVAVLYVGLTSGAVLTWHYCGERLDRVSFTQTKCTDCADKGCCRDEVEVLKVSSDQTAASQISAPSAKILNVFAVTPHKNMGIVAENSASFYTLFTNAPPDVDAVDILVRNCVMRI